MKTVLNFVLLFGFTTASATELMGRWEGPGWYSRSSSAEPLNVVEKVLVQRNGDVLNVWECWRHYYDDARLPDGDCVDSYYDIVNGDQLHYRGQRVGFMVDRRVLITRMTDYSAEQTILEMDTDGSVSLTYSMIYSGGRSLYRQAVMKKLD